MGVRLKKLALAVLACAAALLAPPPHAARAAQCGLPDSGPLWIDFGDGAVPFWKTVFARPGLVLATSDLDQAAQLRAAGAQTIFFDLYLNTRVGTPTAPADPATITDKANRLFDFAVRSSGCSTPLIAENELFGAFTPTPWSATNTQYRANVLAFLRALAARGARPFLLLASSPYTGGQAADWWRQVAQVADIVQEFFTSAPQIHALGPVLGSRTLRVAMRSAVENFTELGIPPSRIGLMLEFESGRGQSGREGLQPAQAWFEVIKLEGLAARQVASELGTATIWSWGWATFTQADVDPDKPLAACVYLWTRDQGLCSGATAAGRTFDSSLTEGQISLPAGVQCSLQIGQINQHDVDQLAAVTGDRQAAATALLERLIQEPKAQLDDNTVLAAERAIILQRFRGVRAFYLRALARAHATIDVARAALADELRREQIEATLPVGSPSPSAVADFYQTYAQALTRQVEATPAPWWLGGQTQGLAIAPFAPAQLFGLPADSPARLSAITGTLTVQPLGPALPLGALPLRAARPAIQALLAHSAQDDAYQAWVTGQETSLLQNAICLRDDLPAAGDVDLAGYLPFLDLSSLQPTSRPSA